MTASAKRSMEPWVALCLRYVVALLFILAMLAAAPAAAQTNVLRNTGDTYVGPLVSRVKANKPALYFPLSPGQSQTVSVSSNGYDLRLGEASTLTTDATARFVVTTAGTFTLHACSAWNSADSTCGSIRARSIVVKGAATGSLSCSSTYAGDIAMDTTTSLLTYCDGTTRYDLATRSWVASNYVSNTAGTYPPKFVLSVTCSSGECTDGTVVASQYLSAAVTECRVTMLMKAAGTSGTYQFVLAYDGTDQGNVSVGLPSSAATTVTTNLTGLSLAAGKIITLRRNGGTGDPMPTVNVECR